MKTRGFFRLLKSEIATRINWASLYGRISYSQEGEDLILQKIFSERGNGFYVDVGAHHPFRYSNTFLFYLQGWNGINIDPTPGVMAYFNRTRRRDINLELAICDGLGKKTLYLFEDSALNTLSEKRAQSVIKSKQSPFLKEREITISRLKDVLRKHPPPHKRIDYLNVDVEGVELQVLESHDWFHYSPRVISVENFSTRSASPISKYMKKRGYTFIAQTTSTQLYQL
ncbi:TPA: SAM-dependent methyltransferase [Patescibacteria group bacterium]|uniref:Methyltransferase FkbM family n=1 Tax=Candidatus Gottesmanbacteria bacterium GW2011_GWA1_43_11 TaxID=1618436 RepID=A0A0G1CD70_9BACT|nr:MAG: Methyltransferase FkbM family [Candidatus Gottesmanbacteria bacterium GW2011_GWA1_43_11]HCS79270.1 SAM-dependent methyltransferase [Patescibacteria group bacterium]